MLPTLAFSRLTVLALVAGLALPLVSAARDAAAPASTESGASSASIRPTLSRPNFFKRKDVIKEVPKAEAQGVSMTELADLIDQKIAEVAARRSAAPVVKLKTQAPRTRQTAAAGDADAAHERLHHGRDVHWAYSGATGPESWGRLKPAYQQCMLGKRQSPIDIRDGLKVQLDPIRFDYRPTRFRVIDNGHTVQVNLDLGNSITVMGQRYELVQFHFHRPSEERVEGRAYPMSAHLVHKSPSGQFAVVGVLLDQGDAHPLIQQVWNNLPLEKNQELAAQALLDPAQILPPQHNQYYTYMGSLTSPPCTENVLWMVMKQPVTVSIDQIAIFHRLYPMNARPVQATSGRMIKEGL
ncbi:MAG: carbonic anhydrase family protein [Aquabacterium sp.]|uniref:carbonic anhydrase n=1 Tax=Aquabacterium sp. TaxID=1872578 RepID=UPI001B53BC75|nr:carbonic anhydrase family protein [Aquabacterium sp.]MBP7131815.1 carbonic anhydrase family protein [Aquabacterium sp.]MBP9063444.1 carbonic anhydrase family protein [Aquabacterium sp.]MDQ5927173.1 carbonic anhydrase [Pseudomonadota bacterium]